MGYFSNGTEGTDYEARYCDRCIHQGGEDGAGCAVWLAQMLYNYDECDKPESILHILIPRTEDDLGNEECRMFIQVGENRHEPHQETTQVART